MDDWDQDQPQSAMRRSDYLRSIAVWPGTTQLDYQGWMSNFKGRDLELAGYLLESFIFISSNITKALFSSAFHHLSSYNYLRGPGRHDENWRDFTQNVIITHVEGETPSTTDSGYLFARMAKKTLGISESQVVTPERALRMFNADEKRAIIFVDDFVGSGDQIIGTWQRQYSLSSSCESSFSESSHINSPIYFIPLFATKSGIEEVKKSCPGLLVAPAHVINKVESPIGLDSMCWPDDLRAEGVAFVERCSISAGIDPKKWRGYNDLGLAIAFDHGTPDATLPIFTHESDSWRPLIK